MPITRTIWRRKVGICHFGAHNTIMPTTGVPLTSFQRMCSTIRCCALLDKISLPPQMRSARRNPSEVTEYWYRTIAIAQLGINLCHSLLRNTTHCPIDRSKFPVECATLASRECARSGPSICLICSWFRQMSVDCIATVASTCHAYQNPASRAIHDFITFPSTTRSIFCRGVA